MQETVDRENSVIITTLPNGDHYRVRTPRQREAKRNALPKLNPGRRRGVAGLMECGKCGSAFTSGSALEQHVREAHGITAGMVAPQAVMLPDGTSVPMEQVLQEFTASRMRESELVADAVEQAAQEE